MYFGSYSTSLLFFFFSSKRRHTRCGRDWSSDVFSSDLMFLIEPYVPIAKIGGAPIEEHSPHANERRIVHCLDLFGMDLESCAPLLKRSCVVQAKIFDVRWNELGFAHGPYNFVEHGDISTGEDIFQCPGIAGYWPLLSDGVKQPDAVALQERSCFFHKRRDELLPHMFKHANGNEFVELALNGPIIFEDDRNLLRQTLTLQQLGCILNLLLRK